MREREFDFVLIVLIHLESAACSENENKGAFQRNKISTMILKKKPRKCSKSTVEVVVVVAFSEEEVVVVAKIYR